MGSFSQEFVNARAMPAGAGLEPVPFAPFDGSAALQRAINFLADGARDRPPGGTLYLPPGRYRVGRDAQLRGIPVRSREPAQLAVPSHVTLAFAPGAELVIPRDVTIEIAGGIAAGLHPIFLIEADAEGRPSSFVRLADSRVPEVYPEWYAAVQVEGERIRRIETLGDTPALQAAIESAHDRPGALPPLPVRLAGTYRLVRPLRIGAPRRPGVEPDPRRAPHGFVLRGARSLGRADAGRPALQCGPDFVGEALLDIQDTGHFVLDSLALDANGRAPSCVAIGTVPGTPARGGRLVGCAFRGATRSLVRLGAPEPRFVAALDGNVFGLLAAASLDLVVQWAVQQDLSGTTFDTCGFEVDRGDGRARAVLLRAARSEGVAFRGCTFVGRAAAMIHAQGGALELVACRFHNRQRPDDPRHVDGPRGGLDLYLDAPPAVRPVPALPLPVRTPATCTATDCVSRSWQFLAGLQGEPAGPVVRDTVLTALVHENVNGSLKGGVAVPSVDWNGLGARGGRLVLVACRLGGPGGRVRVGRLAGRVLDLGTRAELENPFVGEDGGAVRPGVVQRLPR